VLVCNYQPCPQEARLRGLPAGLATIRRLNEETALHAAQDPAAFPPPSQPLPLDSSGELTLTLLSYETVMIEI
jgi:hypothetical protein